MSYLKIENNKIIEAPYMIEKNGKVIYGFNKNVDMMLADGYKFFEKQIIDYEIKNNEIVEKPQPAPIPQPIQTEFSKLQIRRAMRKLGKEDKLDELIYSNYTFQNDWNDAQSIDLNDPMILSALASGLITQEDINAIKEVIE